MSPRRRVLQQGQVGGLRGSANVLLGRRRVSRDLNVASETARHRVKECRQALSTFEPTMNS